jgi:hypothetical protein
MALPDNKLDDELLKAWNNPQIMQTKPTMPNNVKLDDELLRAFSGQGTTPTQQGVPTQPEEQKQGLGAKILDIGKAIERPGIEASQKIRAGYLKATGVIPSVTKLENKVFVEKDRAWLSDMASKGKIPPESDIIAKFGEDRGGKLVAEINRLSPKLFTPQATRRARGEMGTQYATGFFGTVGEEIMNAIEQLTGPEQVLQPSQLAINLAGIGIGSKVATATFDNAIKKGLTDAIKAKTMTPESAKQVFTAYKYYAKNTPAETIQAIMRGDIPTPKVPGQWTTAEMLARKPKPTVSTEQRAGIEYAPIQEEIRQGKKPTVAPVRGAMPSGTQEPITQPHGVEQVQPFAEPSIQKATRTPAEVRADQERQFAEVFPDLTPKAPEKPIETLPEVKTTEIPQEQAKPTEAQLPTFSEEDYLAAKDWVLTSENAKVSAFANAFKIPYQEAEPYFERMAQEGILDRKSAQSAQGLTTYYEIKPQPMPKETFIPFPLQSVADKVRSQNITKEEFLSYINRELSNPNLTKRDTAKNYVAEMEKAGMTPEQFYDRAIGKIEEGMSIQETPSPEMPVTPSGEGVSPKEPYEMTKQEFDNYDQDPYALGVDENAVAKQNQWLEEKKRLVGKRSGQEILKASEKYGGNVEHRWIIENALKEGKQVPDNVLADYPDLAKTTPEPTPIVEPKAETPVREAPKAVSKNKPQDTKIDVGIMSPVLRTPDKIHEYRGYIFGEANQSLAGGKFRYIEVWNKETGKWEYIDSRKTIRTYSQKEIDWLLENRVDKFEDIPVNYERVNPDYEIAKTPKPYVTKYGLDSAEYKWDSYKVKLGKYPEKDLMVYQTKSGWNLRDNDAGATLGKERKGVGWVGFGTKEEAIDNYISKIKAEVVPEAPKVSPEESEQELLDAFKGAMAEHKRLNPKSTKTDIMSFDFWSSGQNFKYPHTKDELNRLIEKYPDAIKVDKAKGLTPDVVVIDENILGKKVSAEEANASLEPEQYPIQKANINEIAVKPDLMQYKQIEDISKGTNKADTLQGQWEDLKGGIVLLWKPKNPAEYGLTGSEKYIVANGHHRLEFAKRNNRQSLNVQILDEANGYSADDARVTAAEVNITEGKGTIYDQVRYLRGQSAALGKDEALGAGRRIGAKGRQATTIAFETEDSAYSAFINRDITPEQTEIIAKTAPNDELAQRFGVKQALAGKQEYELQNIIKASQVEKAQRATEGKTLDLFGQDDSAFQKMESMSKIATEYPKQIREQLRTIQGAGKRPDIARQFGIDVNDPMVLQGAIDKMKYDLQRWENWSQYPDLVAKVRQKFEANEAVNYKQETLDLTAKKGETHPPEGITDEEIAQIKRNITEKGQILPPEDLIRKFMDRNGYTRAEAIEDIRKHGGFASFGFKQKPSLAQNPIKANNDVIDKYAEGISMEAEKEKFGMGKIWQSFQTLYNWTVHRYQPIARITNFAQKGAVVPEGENPMLLAKRYSGVEKIASEKIFKETRRRNPDGSSTVTGEGLAQILEPVSQDIKDFSAFLTAEKDIELLTLDKPIKGSPKQAEAYKAISALKNKYGTNFRVFEDAGQEFRGWTKRAMLDELKEIGFLSQKSYDNILDSNRFYAPMQRLMDEAERRGVIPSSREAFTPQGKPIYARKGSERIVIDPLESAITNCYRITDFIERQRVSNATINLRNIDPRLQTVITEGRGRYEIPVYENGVRKLYNVPKDLHTALKGMDEADMGTLMRIVSFPTRTLRAGATLIPEFWFRNPIRDQFTAFVNAKYGFYPGYDFIKGIFHVLKKDELYHEAAASGAFQSMFTSLDRMTSRATLKDVLRGRQKYWSPKHPIEAVRSLSQLFEEGTRTGIYGRAKSGGDILYKAFHRGEPKPSELGAMFEYREASTDFARRGSQTKAVNQLIAFWNANIQGVDKMVRSFKDRPIESTIRAISSITIPSISLYLLNKDNPRYKELPQWEKDFFWIIIPSDNSPIIRIPKPFELGILFGTSAEHLIDYVEKRDPEAVKDLANSAWQALTPGMIPTGLQPPIESWANKNLFTNRPIVPQSLAKLPPEMQAEPYTSEVARAVGTWVKYSPLKIDNAIRGYFGGMGKYFTDSIDSVIKKYGAKRPPEPTKTLADIPLIRGFVAREPIGSVSESVNKFYKTYDDIQKVNNAVKQFQKEGNAKKTVEYIQKHPEGKFLSGFTTIAFSMAKARRTIQAIYDDKKMSPENKRKAIDELNTLITKQAELALDVYNNAKKTETEPAKPISQKATSRFMTIEEALKP